MKDLSNDKSHLTKQLAIDYFPAGAPLLIATLLAIIKTWLLNLIHNHNQELETEK